MYSLNGIVLGHKNIKVVNHVQLNDDGNFALDYVADIYIFKPEVGNLLSGISLFFFLFKGFQWFICSNFKIYFYNLIKFLRFTFNIRFDSAQFLLVLN